MRIDKETYNTLLAIKNGKPWFAHKSLVALLKRIEVQDAVEAIKNAPTGNFERNQGTRTLNQNSAIHLWLTQLAEELDKHGFTIQNIVAKIQRAGIRPTMRGLKEVL